MGSEIHDQLHIFFFPFIAHGHMIPTMDMAKLFATRGVKSTIITTPLNVPFFSKIIEKGKEYGIEIGVKTLKFPTVELGLPEGCESADFIPSSQEEGAEMRKKFFKATAMLQEPLENLLQEFKPDCLVADMFFPWATDAANKFGIPRLVFHGTCFFSLCAAEFIRLYEPHKEVESDSEPFLVPKLPGDIKMTKSQLPDFMKIAEQNDFKKLVIASRESEVTSYGVIVNSFYELEGTYADCYRNVLGRKAWNVGPVSLCNRAAEDKAERSGKKSAIDQHECLKWLDSKKPNSVIYVCFGSRANFTSAQLKEIAMALEASEQQFVWVVSKQKNTEEEEEDWLPEGFEKRMEGKGLIIRGWAPQVLILEHQAIGGFVTHCGWNSTLEGVSAGVPMVTWPIGAEQFYNEKLVNQVLKIGVGVGVQRWVKTVGDFVMKEAIEKAVKEIMKGDKAEEMRNRAKLLAEAAKRAVDKGGSSYSDLNALIEELSLRRRQ
ncbi:UDP-glucuronosyl/UDP-glucosyltransferase [Corchorus capsularis]|uniref:Glycosyltransferase n=1 Tax=Corchorus capsularis TaxID=210143 RepID=A0A1R3HV37_COCAP|nr:UDP-glucuronosyl/UDP-glucosyltransferase [Corchorus capsularis]